MRTPGAGAHREEEPGLGPRNLGLTQPPPVTSWTSWQTYLATQSPIYKAGWLALVGTHPGLQGLGCLASLSIGARLCSLFLDQVRPPGLLVLILIPHPQPSPEGDAAPLPSQSIQHLLERQRPGGTMGPPVQTSGRGGLSMGQGKTSVPSRAGSKADASRIAPTSQMGTLSSEGPSDLHKKCCCHTPGAGGGQDRRMAPSTPLPALWVPAAGFRPLPFGAGGNNSTSSWGIWATFCRKIFSKAWAISTMSSVG